MKDVCICTNYVEKMIGKSMEETRKELHKYDEKIHKSNEERRRKFDENKNRPV